MSASGSMPSNNLLHRDCATLNIMMDARSMYPNGFHPVYKWRDLSATETATHYTRSECPPRYYFTDFGMSSYFPPDCDPLVVGCEGRDFEVPELSKTVPYNPFKTDIFIIGNLLKKEFFYVSSHNLHSFECALKPPSQRYSNVDFMYPLITILAEQDPKMRPTAYGAQQMWKHVRASVSIINRYWRLRGREDDGYLVIAIRDVISFVRRTIRLSQWAPTLNNMLT